MNLLWFTPPRLGHLVFLAPFLIREFLSLEPIGLPHFNRVMNKYQLYLEHLAVDICDLITLFVSVKKSDNWLTNLWMNYHLNFEFTFFCMRIKRDNDNSFQPIFLSKCFLSRPNVGKTYSSKITVDKSNCKYVSYQPYILNRL